MGPTSGGKGPGSSSAPPEVFDSPPPGRASSIGAAGASVVGLGSFIVSILVLLSVKHHKADLSDHMQLILWWEVHGAFGLLGCVVGLATSIASACSQTNADICDRINVMCNGAVALFGFAWYVVGNCRLYLTHPCDAKSDWIHSNATTFLLQAKEVQQKQMSHKCVDATLWNTTRTYFLFSYVGLAILLVLCMGCCGLIIVHAFRPIPKQGDSLKKKEDKAPASLADWPPRTPPDNEEGLFTGNVSAAAVTVTGETTGGISGAHEAEELVLRRLADIGLTIDEKLRQSVAQTLAQERYHVGRTLRWFDGAVPVFESNHDDGDDRILGGSGGAVPPQRGSGPIYWHADAHLLGGSGALHGSHSSTQSRTSSGAPSTSAGEKDRDANALNEP